MYWHELSDTGNICTEFTAFIVQKLGDVKLDEAEMEATLQENNAVFARWLREDMLLEYASNVACRYRTLLAR